MYYRLFQCLHEISVGNVTDGIPWVEAGPVITFSCQVSAIKPENVITWEIDEENQPGWNTDATENGDTSFQLISVMQNIFPAQPEQVTVLCSVPDRDATKWDSETYEIYRKKVSYTFATQRQCQCGN